MFARSPASQPGYYPCQKLSLSCLISLNYHRLLIVVDVVVANFSNKTMRFWSKGQEKNLQHFWGYFGS